VCIYIYIYGEQEAEARRVLMQTAIDSNAEESTAEILFRAAEEHASNSLPFATAVLHAAFRCELKASYTSS
jgi:hypothetical protein